VYVAYISKKWFTRFFIVIPLQGVRVYTFFVYLSDVEEGGGTKFNDLGITVTPKLGRAVLWPSVKDHDLLTGKKINRSHTQTDREQHPRHPTHPHTTRTTP